MSQLSISVGIVLTFTLFPLISQYAFLRLPGEVLNFRVIFFLLKSFFFFLQFLIENLKSLCLSVWSLKCNCFISACISKHFPKHLLKGHLAFGEDAVTLTINETKCSEPVPQKYSMIDV